MVDVEENSFMFFKVLLDDFKDNLRLSEKFVALSERAPEVKLRTAFGGKKKKEWSVQAQDSGGMLYLTGDGWRRFVEDHDLRLGYFLVFIYCSGVTFYVVPFDLTGFRIAYNKPVPIQDTTTNMEDCCVMDVDEDDVKYKEAKDDDRLKLQKKVKKKNVSLFKKNLKVQRKPKFKKTSMQSSYYCNEIEKKKMNEEKKLKVGKNTLFKHIIQSSYIEKGLVNLPAKFCKINNLLTVNEAIITTAVGSWSLKICHCQRKKMSGTYSFLSAGCTAFLRENNLKKGDTCIFDLSSRDENRAKFYVTKEEITDDGDDILKMDKKKNTVEKNLKVWKKPQFKIIMKPTSRLNFPTYFRNSNDLSRIDKVTLMTNKNIGRRWLVKLRHYQSENRSSIVRSAFTFGWTSFIRESNFKEGDICIFELFSKEGSRASFLVTKEDDFSRKNDSGSHLIRPQFEVTKEDDFSKKNDSGSHLIRPQFEGIKEVDFSTKSSTESRRILPHFEITIMKKHLNSSGAELHVPVRFGGIHCLFGKSNVMLTRNGKSWEVGVITRTYNSHMYPKLTRGWKRFCFDNKLEEGDVCSFELGPIEGAVKLEMIVNIKKKHPILKRSNIPERNLNGPINCTKELESSLSCRPHFKATITKTQIFGKISELHIPVSFSALHNLRGKSEVTLTNSMNESWEVVLMNRDGKYRDRYYRFYKGWKEFCNDNRLEEGDVCSFELISDEDAAKIEMSVSLSKK